MRPCTHMVIKPGMIERRRLPIPGMSRAWAGESAMASKVLLALGTGGEDVITSIPFRMVEAAATDEKTDVAEATTVDWIELTSRRIASHCLARMWQVS